MEIVESLKYAKLGIKIQHVEAFITKCGGRSALQNLTTADICKKHIIPLTAASKVSYCEMLSKSKTPNERNAVGDASVFVCHAWKYIFLDVVDTLFYHFKDKKDTCVWFDVFSFKQQSDEKDMEWLSITLPWVLGQVDYTVMVWTSWLNTAPLSRTWCLYELYCTIMGSGKPLEIIMNAEQEQTFFAKMAENGEDVMNQILGEINMEKSEISNEEERQTMFTALFEMTGHSTLSLVTDKVDSVIIEKITDLLMQKLSKEITTQSQRKAFTPKEKEIKLTALQYQLANYYYERHHYMQAEELFTSIYTQRKRLLGEIHIDLLPVLNSLALLYYSQGKYTLAEGYYQECIAKSNTLFNGTQESQAIETFSTHQRISLVYKHAINWTVVNILYQDCVVRRKTDRTASASSPTSTSNPPMLQTPTRAYVYQAALTAKEKEEELKNFLHLAKIYETYGNLLEAEILYTECDQLSQWLYSPTEKKQISAEKETNQSSNHNKTEAKQRKFSIKRLKILKTIGNFYKDSGQFVKANEYHTQYHTLHTQFLQSLAQDANTIHVSLQNRLKSTSTEPTSPKRVSGHTTTTLQQQQHPTLSTSNEMIEDGGELDVDDHSVESDHVVISPTHNTNKSFHSLTKANLDQVVHDNATAVQAVKVSPSNTGKGVVLRREASKQIPMPRQLEDELDDTSSIESTDSFHDHLRISQDEIQRRENMRGFVNTTTTTTTNTSSSSPTTESSSSAAAALSASCTPQAVRASIATLVEEDQTVFTLMDLSIQLRHTAISGGPSKECLSLAFYLTNEIYTYTLHTFGGEDSLTLSAMNNLANVYYSQEQYALAQEWHKDCLDKRKKFLGEDSLDTLQSMHNLACVYYHQKKRSDAEMLWKQCLRRRISLLGDQHRLTRHTRSQLATLTAGLSSTSAAAATGPPRVSSTASSLSSSASSSILANKK